MDHVQGNIVVSVCGREEYRHVIIQWNTVCGSRARENRRVCAWEGRERACNHIVEHYDWTTCQGDSLCLSVGGKGTNQYTHSVEHLVWDHVQRKSLCLWVEGKGWEQAHIIKQWIIANLIQSVNTFAADQISFTLRIPL